MTAMFRPWWRDRSSREQLLLMVMAALLIATFFWLGVARPLALSREVALTRHARAEADLAEARAMAMAIRKGEARASAAGNRSLVAHIGTSANQAGLTLARLEANGDTEAQAQIDAVRPQPLLTWLMALETRDGVIVERVAITRNDDSTVAARLTLRSPG